MRLSIWIGPVRSLTRNAANASLVGSTKPVIALSSKRRRKTSAVEQQILPGDEAGLVRAQKRAGRAEFIRGAEAFRRHAVDARGARLLDADIAFLGGILD